MDRRPRFGWQGSAALLCASGLLPGTRRARDQRARDRRPASGKVGRPVELLSTEACSLSGGLSSRGVEVLYGSDAHLVASAAVQGHRWEQPRTHSSLEPWLTTQPATGTRLAIGVQAPRASAAGQFANRGGDANLVPGNPRPHRLNWRQFGPAARQYGSFGLAKTSPGLWSSTAGTSLHRKRQGRGQAAPLAWQAGKLCSRLAFMLFLAILTILSNIGPIYSNPFLFFPGLWRWGYHDERAAQRGTGKADARNRHARGPWLQYPGRRTVGGEEEAYNDLVRPSPVFLTRSRALFVSFLSPSQVRSRSSSEHPAEHPAHSHSHHDVFPVALCACRAGRRARVGPVRQLRHRLCQWWPVLHRRVVEPVLQLRHRLPRYAGERCAGRGGEKKKGKRREQQPLSLS
jgi:hypothetical protein